MFLLLTLSFWSCEEEEKTRFSYNDLPVKPSSRLAFIRINAGDTTSYTEEGQDYFRAGSGYSARVDGKLYEYAARLDSDSSLYDYIIQYSYGLDDRTDRIKRVISPDQSLAQYGSNDLGEFIINQTGFTVIILKKDSLDGGGNGYGSSYAEQSKDSFFNVNEFYRSTGDTGNHIWLGGDFSATVIRGRPSPTAPEQIEGEYFMSFMF